MALNFERVYLIPFVSNRQQNKYTQVAVKKLQAKRVKTNSPKILNNPEPTTSTATS
jgi:hypothetical protein